MTEPTTKSSNQNRRKNRQEEEEESEAEKLLARLKALWYVALQRKKK